MVSLSALVLMCAPAVHLDTMLKIVAHESGGNPFAIGINSSQVHLPRQPQSLSEAIGTATTLKASGFDFDAGLGQLNARNIERLGLTFEQVFDPCQNLAATSQILYDNYVRASRRFTTVDAALTAALSAYNTGDFSRGVTNGYVKKVLNAKPEKISGKLIAPASVPALTAVSLPVIASSSGASAVAPAKRKTVQAQAVLASDDGVSGFFSDGSSDKYNGWL